PYLANLTFLFMNNEDAEILRFQAGETDVLNRMGADNYAVLDHQGNHSLQLEDLGPSLEYNFLLFNLNTQIPNQTSDLKGKQSWFEDVRFRQAISAAIDRNAMTRIVYHGLGTPLYTHVTPGNKLWLDGNLPHTARSIEHAHQLLREAGFSQ